MRFNRITSLGGDLARMNLAYLHKAESRNRIRHALESGNTSRAIMSLIAQEAKGAPAAAVPFAGLSDDSLALAGIRTSPAARPALNVVIGHARAENIFAGVRTALLAAARLATHLGMPLRVVMLDPLPARRTIEDSATNIRAVVGEWPVEVVARENIRRHHYCALDVWLATHYKTAHAIQVACDSGVIDRRKVAYLMQDYEPGFSPWSTDSVLAEATYHAGFIPIVNSEPLAAYLRKRGHEISPELVFAPAFPESELERSAADRKQTSGSHVLFYARPRKHRNLYGLGVSAVKYAAEQLGSDVARVTFSSLGERHRPVALPNDAVLVGKGRLDWSDYFRFLSTVDVVLSLQQSPHPSHPPFDAAISGAQAITNDFDGSRGNLHPRIVAVPANTASVGTTLVEAIRRSWDSLPGGYLPVDPGKLGRKLDDVLRAAAQQLA